MYGVDFSFGFSEKCRLSIAAEVFIYIFWIAGLNMLNSTGIHMFILKCVFSMFLSHPSLLEIKVYYPSLVWLVVMLLLGFGL